MKGLRDLDAIAFHMKKDASICCPSKTTAPRRRRLLVASDEEDENWYGPNSDSDSEDGENTNKSIKHKRKKVKTNETPKTALRREINRQAYGSTWLHIESDTRNEVKDTFDVQSVSQYF